MVAAHDSNGDGVLDSWMAYWDWVDYLSAQCAGINGYRGEGQ
jgi:hypothetical protein